MNRYNAYPRRIPGGIGFHAMVRLCRDSEPSPIMDTGDKPKVFTTKGEAAEECLKHMVAFMNGREIRGEMFDIRPKAAGARARAEKLFMGGGKTIQVERVSARG